MLSQEIEKKLAERLAKRINDINRFILIEIGTNIKRLSMLNTREINQLAQMLKYGGSYEKIAKKLAEVSNKNIQEIYEMFEEIAKNNKDFAKQFYQYRNIDFIPYSKDIALQEQVKSLTRITAGEFLNFSNTRVVGYVFEDLDGNRTFKNIQESYQEVIDRAILSISQGKDSFYNNMRQTLQELGNSGLVEYKSGKTRRLDSAVRMNVLDGIRRLNRETSLRFGQEYDADGVEISVHQNPAPDHADIQGRQFSLEEFEKLENGDVAVDCKGNKYDGADKRHIGEYNCYHKTFNIVLGVSKPQYTDEQLKNINEENEKGFEFEGKHYTNYEGTQLQRRIETAIRKQKDTKLLAQKSGDDVLELECDEKIEGLRSKYNELCKISGLRPQLQRMGSIKYESRNR